MFKRYSLSSSLPFLHRTRTSRLSDLVMLMQTRVKLMNLPLNCTEIATFYFIFVNKSLVVNDNAFCRLYFYDKLTIASCFRARLDSNWNSQKKLSTNENEKRQKRASCCVCGCFFFLMLWEVFSPFYEGKNESERCASSYQTRRRINRERFSSVQCL